MKKYTRYLKISLLLMLGFLTALELYASEHAFFEHADLENDSLNMVVNNLEDCGFTVSPVHVTCNGESDGRIIIDSEDTGMLEIDYSWQLGVVVSGTFFQGVYIIDDLAPGTYSVTITANNGQDPPSDLSCGPTTFSLQINEPDPLQIDSVQILTNIICQGDTDGSATVFASGGTEPYSYEWTGGETSQTANNLEAGEITVTVTDANGCDDTETFEILGAPVLEISSQGVLCFGDNDGEATVTVNTGTAPFDYKWSNGVEVLDSDSFTSTISGLEAGEYSVEVTDDGGCEGEISVEVDSPEEPLTVEIVKLQDVDCFGGTDGSAIANGDGGTPLPGDEYTYVWDNQEETRIATALDAGEHSVTITDANGCEATETITINQPDALETTMQVVELIPCEEGGYGTLMVTVTGGTPEYDYDWSGDPHSIDDNLANYADPGLFFVTVTDENDCEIKDSLQLGLDEAFEITDYPEFAAFEDNVAQSLNYTIEDFDVLHWTILEKDCIDTTAQSYIAQDESDQKSISLTFVLENSRTSGRVLLEVYPSSGTCIGTPVQTSILVSSKGDPVFVPEVFSPNGDGMNDVLEVVFPDSGNPDDYSITIFNRNGQKVYEANSMAQPWDGAGCTDGPYFWVIMDMANDKQYQGAVSILR